MSKAITNIKKLEIPEEEQQNKDIQEILSTLAENKEAVIEAVTHIRRLHETGILEFLNAFLARSDEMLSIAMKEANKPENMSMLQNLVGLSEVIGSLNLDKVKELSQKMNNGIEEATEPTEGNQTTSMIQLLKALKDPEVNRAVTMLLNFLKGVGKET